MFYREMVAPMISPAFRMIRLKGDWQVSVVKLTIAGRFADFYREINRFL